MFNWFKRKKKEMNLESKEEKDIIVTTDPLRRHSVETTYMSKGRMLYRLLSDIDYSDISIKTVNIGNSSIKRCNFTLTFKDIKNGYKVKEIFEYIRSFNERYYLDERHGNYKTYYIPHEDEVIDDNYMIGILIGFNRGFIVSSETRTKIIGNIKPEFKFTNVSLVMKLDLSDKFILLDVNIDYSIK